MKTSACLVLALAVLSIDLFAQTRPPGYRPYEANVSPGVAEKMLIRKVDPDACPHVAMAAHVTGTVVVAIGIDKNGNVLRPIVVSGPAMLQKPVLDAVGKYKYKPYFLNGEAIVVGTTVSVQIDSVRDCHTE